MEEIKEPNKCKGISCAWIGRLITCYTEAMQSQSKSHQVTSPM
jgi:hypothetical protein